jgi:hypothetical protein
MSLICSQDTAFEDAGATKPAIAETISSNIVSYFAGGPDGSLARNRQVATNSYRVVAKVQGLQHNLIEAGLRENTRGTVKR